MDAISKSILDAFKTLTWPDLVIDETKVNISVKQGESSFPLLETNADERVVHFIVYNAEEDKYEPRNGIKSIKVDKDFDLSSLLYIRDRKYELSYSRQIRQILDIDPAIETISIQAQHRGVVADTAQKLLKISIQKYQEVLFDARTAAQSSKRYRNSIERYLINRFYEKHTKRKIQSTTNLEQGEFDFLVHRLNLNTKKKKADFQKYLNEADISSLQDLFSALVGNEVFSSNFLRKLNDYFIREHLKEIIKTGKEIFNLGSTNLKTTKAKKVIGKVAEDKRTVRQLETLWQQYFEKYLLFLIFSYKGIFPKIELLDIEGDKKYPDFIGINHYNGVDVIEIKTHLKYALVYDRSHENFAFSAELSRAIIQTTNYMDAVIHTNFKNSGDKQKITNSTHEENLNRPRGIIIISSTDKLAKNINHNNKAKIVRDFTKLRNSLHNIEILTFDEIINIAGDYLKNIVKE